MNTVELVMVVREKLDDLVEPYLVSDVDMVEALNRAQKEFVRSTYSTFVENTAPITDASPWVDVPANVLIVRSVIHNDKQLRVVTTHEMDFGYFRTTGDMSSTRWTNWRAVSGTPRFAITDMGPGQLRLVPRPDVTAVSDDPNITLEGYGVPDPMDLTSVNPNVPMQYEEDLALGALFHIYSNQDTDFFDVNQAQNYFQLWKGVIRDAQAALNTAVRVQQRNLRLPRGFAPTMPTADSAVQPPPQQQQPQQGG